jgi:hypothetical protein
MRLKDASPAICGLAVLERVWEIAAVVTQIDTQRT